MEKKFNLIDTYIEQYQEEYNNLKDREDISTIEKMRPLVMIQNLIQLKLELLSNGR